MSSAPDAALASAPDSGGGVTVLHDNGGHAEGECRAQDGAGVLGIGDLIEHEHDAAAAVLRRRDVRQAAIGEGFAFERDTLMAPRRGGRSRDTASALTISGRTRREEILGQLFRRTVREDKAFRRPPRIGQRGGHRMMTIEPEAWRGRGA